MPQNSEDAQEHGTLTDIKVRWPVEYKFRARYNMRLVPGGIDFSIKKDIQRGGCVFDRAL